MFYRFAADVPLRWVDVDSAGVVNNAAYLSLMEQARFMYFQHLGLLGENGLLGEFRVPFVLAEITVKFQLPGRLGMKVEVAAATKSLGNTSFRMIYEVRAADDVLASAEATLVFVDSHMKPCAIPAEVREAVAQFEELPGR